MLGNALRRLVRGFFWIGVVYVVAADLAGAQEIPQRSAKDVQVRIETQKGSYRVGESILVRLTLRNVSAEPLQYTSSLPTTAVLLRVLDDSGRTLAADYKLNRQWFNGLRSGEITIKSGEERILKYRDEEWMDLRDWGI